MDKTRKSTQTASNTKDRPLTEAELAEFQEMFSLVDKDGGGSISKEELADLMALLNIRKTPDELEADMAEIDADGSGDISFNEFVMVMRKAVNTSYTSEQIKAAFKVFEVPVQPGFVNADQLIKALTQYGSEKSTLEEATELVNQLEADGHGMVNYLEYVRSMMSDDK